MKKYIFGILSTFILISFFGFNLDKKVNEISNKLFIGSAWIKDTLTTSLSTSGDLNIKDNLNFRGSGNYGINAVDGSSLIDFNVSGQSIDFGTYDVIINPAYGLTASFIQNLGDQLNTGYLALTGRLKTSKGSNVASATTTTLGTGGNFFTITGTTNIDQITVSSWTTGSIIVLRFDDVLTLDNKSGNSGQFELAGATDFTTSARDIIVFVLDGTTWCEVTRSLN